MPVVVYLVGAGPGDPGLITVRGQECLARAELVLYDSLANPALLELAPLAAERVCAGKHGQGPLPPRAEIVRQMVEAAQAGRIVVRLKGGDPAIFGHLAEEVAALEAAGVPYEIVPGVSAGVAVGSYAALALTSRQAASAVAFVTGQETRDKAPPGCDYRALAQFPGTLVFYMGVTTAPQWSAELIAGGLSPDTPTLVVRRCTWPDQQSIRCRLADVGARMADEKLRPPVLVVVGQVAAETGAENWFERLPLRGQTVLLTRPRERNDAPRRALEELGANVLVQPLIETQPPSDWSEVDHAIEQLGTFDWLTVSSPSGVEYFFDRLSHRGRDARALGGLKVAAIGSATAEALLERGIRADLVPEEFRAESLAEALVSLPPRRVLILRASRGRDVLAQTLTTAGHQPTELVVYQSLDVAAIDEGIAQAIAAGRIDWVTVTSSSIARAIARLLAGVNHQPRLASISPITSAALREVGLAPTVEAPPPHTIEGLIGALVEAAPAQAD